LKEPRAGLQINHDIPALTGLRGVAAVMVFIAHAIPVTELSARSPGSAISRILEAGWMGVPLFFALSGYLITWLALKEKDDYGSFDLGRFCIRRCLRIWPLYYTVVALAILAGNFSSIGWLAPEASWVPALLLFAVNLVITHRGSGSGLGVLLPFWTLAAEEQFYLIWGLALKTFTQRNLAIFAGVLLFISIVFHWLPLPYGNIVLYRVEPAITASSIMFGCLLALSRDWVAPFEKRMRLITALWLVMLAAVIFFTPQANFPTWALSLETLAVDITSVLAVWLASTSGTIISRILSAKPLIFLGNISYCLYAVHVPVIGSFGRGLNFGEAMGRMSPVGAVLYYLLAPLITACLISWLWTRAEEPIRKLRKQWRRTGKAKS
jgi:peptidoglycan/LPS O-acetylase OafA/YrhL